MLSASARRCLSSTTTARVASKHYLAQGGRGAAGRIQARQMTRSALALAPKALSTTSAVRAFSSYSSFADPNPTLIDVKTADDVMLTAEDTNLLLRQDIRVMGSLLGKVVKEHEGEEIFTKVEQMRAHAKTWRDEQSSAAAAADETFAKLAKYVEGFTDKELYTVSRAFTHFLALANAAEGHHRARRLQASMGEAPSGA